MQQTRNVKRNSGRRKGYFRKEWPLHVMMLIPVIFLVIYRYIPMGGLVIAFENYRPAKGILGSIWVGLDNFKTLFSMEGFRNAFKNTLIISIGKIVLNIVVPVAFSLILNEIHNKIFKRAIQTLVYLPHFISWVLLSSILVKLLSQNGIVNQLITAFGGDSVTFLADKKMFPLVLIFSEVWKEFGYTTIVYIAAIAGISPALYEAAIVDGASRWKQTVYVTLPSMLPTIILMTMLSLGRVLDAGFDQVFNLYSPVVYETGDIIDTFVYRLGFDNFQYSLSTAASLIKSMISAGLIVLSYRVAYKLSGYRIF